MQTTMFVRPDEIIRSGSIQPFNVVSQNPVTYARHEIDPFINAIRPQGSSIVTIDGAGRGGGLGIINPEVIRTISGGLGADAPAEPGLFERMMSSAAEADKYRKQRLVFGAVGLLAGILGTYAVTKLF